MNQIITAVLIALFCGILVWIGDRARTPFNWVCWGIAALVVVIFLFSLIGVV